MSAVVPRAVAASLLGVALGLGVGCASKAVAPAQGVASAPGATSVPSPSPSPSPLPIGVSAQRVGSRYVFLTKTKGDRKLYILRADAERGHYFGADTGVSTFVNPHVIFYGRDGKRLVADAPTGTVVEREKTVRMSGGVRALAQDGLRLHCDTLTYDDETDLIHGLGNVTVVSPKGEELQGETLTWNLRDGAIDIAGAH